MRKQNSGNAKTKDTLNSLAVKINTVRPTIAKRLCNTALVDEKIEREGFQSAFLLTNQTEIHYSLVLQNN